MSTDAAYAQMPFSPSETKLALAERVYALRTSFALTQKRAAQRIGERQPTWAGWEVVSTQRMPSATQLAAIEHAFGVPREWVQSGITDRMPLELAEKVARALALIKARRASKERNKHLYGA